MNQNTSNSNNWVYDDGAMKQSFTSFPYAFRYMWNAQRKWVEGGNNLLDLTKRIQILSPFNKIYSYIDAIRLAEASGLLKPDGELNKKEFKKR